MYAYDKDVMLSAREHFAVMMDYAVGWCSMGLRDYYNRFLGSGIAELMGRGYPMFSLGMSGIELAARVVEKTGGTLPLDDSYIFPWEDSSTYWTGWAICQYQWYKGVSFMSIDRNGLPIETVHDLFHPLHEADISKVMDAFDSYYKESRPSLKTLRKGMGLTQEELSIRSGVSLRMIRAYEQGTQDLSRAEAATAARLARSLGCPEQVLVG